MNRTHALTALAALLLVAASQAQADQTVAYDAQMLTVSGASYTQALGINQAGQVVGMAQISSASHAITWMQGAATDLGAGQANAVNANARIAGSSIGANGREYAAVWVNQQPTLLGEGAAYAINDQDEVVGEALGTDGVRHPAVWRNGVLTLLSTQAGRATGINKSGQIVGYINSTVDGATSSSAIRWVQDVPTVLSAYAMASGINDTGTVVGSTIGRPDNRAYWTPDNQLHMLTQATAPAGYLTAINNIGQIAGTVYGIGIVQSLPGSTPVVLSSSYIRHPGDTAFTGGIWYNVYPQGITDSGMIAGSYCNGSSAEGVPRCAAFMFKPTPAACSSHYSLSTISSIAFSETINLTNMTTGNLVGWQVNETLKNATLVYKVSSNAKVKVSGGGVNILATPSSATQATAAQSTTTVSFSGSTLTAPAVASLNATMGGQACIPTN